MLNSLRALQTYWVWFWRSPVAFVDGLPWAAPRAFFLAELTVLAALVDVFNLRLLWQRVRLRWPAISYAELPLDAGERSFRLLETKGVWPARLRLSVDRGAAVFIARDASGRLLSCDRAEEGSDALLRCSSPVERIGVIALDRNFDTFAVRPCGTWDAFTIARARGADRVQALLRIWPPAERPHVQATQSAYRAWIARNEPYPAPERPPTAMVSVLTPVYHPDPAHLQAAIGSVLAQTYPRWELILVEDGPGPPLVEEVLERAAEHPQVRFLRLPVRAGVAAATNAALEAAAGEVVLFLDHDDLLSPDALLQIAAVFEDPSAEAVYSDEDTVDQNGVRSAPVFKTCFDPERLLAQNYVNHAFAVRTALARRVGGLRDGFDGAQDHEFVLRITRHAPRSAVRHLPQVLYHWRIFPGGRTLSQRAPLQATAARQRAVAEHLALQGRQARLSPGYRGYNRAHWAAPAPLPRVRAIIPTRDRPDLLAGCVAGLLHGTNYDRLEITVVDNGSVRQDTLALLDQLRRQGVRVMRIDAPFNYPELNNAAAEGFGDGFLLFLNDDVLVTEPEWLRELASLAAREEVGAVGPKLLYPDGRLQHAGLTLGLGPEGVAGHDCRGAAANAAGPQGRFLVAREAAAVTGACLLVSAAKFRAAGGFDPSLAVAYNDVDLCLRLRSLGWPTLWTPHAELIHLESASRGRDVTPVAAARLAGEAAFMRERWGELLRTDPYYHPALTLEDEGLALAPRRRDWRARGCERTERMWRGPDRVRRPLVASERE